MKPIPLDYYVEAERRKMLVEAQRARALFQSYDKVADFVLNDILAKKQWMNEQLPWSVIF